jgi:lysozyme family protein
MDIWDQRIAALFGREGAYSDNAHDHGDTTAWGIIAQQSCRYIEIAEHEASQEDFEFGWQLHRALGAIA